MSCNCGKPKCDGKCGISPSVLQINNPGDCTLFHRVEVPASMGDSTTNPPKNGDYRNVLLYYVADGTSWLFSSDGIPQKLVNGFTNYEDAVNLPIINNVTLIGSKTGADLGLQDKLIAGDNIQIAADGKTISATDTTYGPATDDTIGLVKPGDGLEVASDGAMSISDIEQYAHFFDTVADMKAATNLVAGDYARTLGYYSIGDGGGATYTISSTGTANEKNIIAVGGVIANLVYGKNINVKQFGAKGDGTTDDTAYIQAALDALQYSGSLYFPKGYNYLITDTLTLGADDACLYSEPKTEYSTRITCSTANKTIMNITGYGATIKNLAFYGDGTDSADATISGLNFDRTPLGDAQTYSNIDCVIEDCLFFRLKDCITVKGRNARIKYNTFTASKNGIVGVLHEYGPDHIISDFRGYWIIENCFHSMNDRPGATSGKTMATLDSACIAMPLESNKVGNISILNNKAEFCGSHFYKGYLPTVQINNNYIYFCASTFVYSPVDDPDMYDLSTRRVSEICSNTVIGRTDETFDNNFVYIKDTSNVKLTDNVFRTCNGSGIVGVHTHRFNIDNNIIQQFGVTTSGKSGIELSGDASSYISNNIINGFSTGEYGVTSTSNVYLRDNSFGVLTTPINVSGEHIKSSVYATSWTTPTLLNSFTFNDTYNLGYRKLEDGRTEVQIALKGGIDNSNAFQLPSGFRPSRGFVLPNVSLDPDSGIDAWARFYTSGDVRINWGGGTPGADDTYVINAIFD